MICASGWQEKREAVLECKTKLRSSMAERRGDIVNIKSISYISYQRPPFPFEDKSPVAKEWQENEDKEKTQPFFDSKTVTLARDEVHDFIIIGSAKRSLVLWRLYLDLEVGGKPQTIEIDENGKPFKTTGYPDGGFCRDLEWAWHDGQRFQQIVE